MSKSMVRIQCNLCHYNLLVTEALEPWAVSVMEAHGKRIHPQYMELPETTKKESADEETV